MPDRRRKLSVLRGSAETLRTNRIHAVYFEYCEKWLARVQPPSHVLTFLKSLGYRACFCRAAETGQRGGASHTIRQGLPGHGLPLLPIGALLPDAAASASRRIEATA